MRRRLHQTLADYLVLAITPALIMFMVGSLVQFLLGVFYQGNYPERLSFTMTMFVFAAVLIARISMTEGAEKAVLYGVALALVVALALDHYVDYGKNAPLRFPWAINWSLMALIWWYAHKLTWDCTLIGDDDDAGGEGLLQSAGLDRSGAGETPDAPLPPPEPESVTDRSLAPARWWQRFVKRRRRPHAHGVWVVYFSLAALPLFGIGQLFFSTMTLDRRRHAFWLLCVYVASGLGLLLTTSFLGLRRYLRQRGLEMPLAMANSWVAVGSVLIVGVLVFAALLPRPNPEYAISELPIQVGSPDQRASQISVGSEGTPDEQGGTGTSSQPKPDATQAPDSQGQNSAAKPESGGGRQTEKTGEGSRSDGKSGEARGNDKSENKGEANSQKNGAQGEKTGEKTRDKTGQGTSGGEAKDGSKKGGQSQSDRAPPQGEQKGSRPPAQGQEQKPDSSASKSENSNKTENSKSDEPPQTTPRPGAGSTSPSTPPPPSLPSLDVGGWVSLIARWLFYAAVCFFVAWGLYHYHREVLAWLRELIEQLRQFWEALFGGKRRAPRDLAADETSAKPVLKSFSEFADPFASGQSGRWTGEELLTYSFEALEAWGREQGLARLDEETPLEFSRRLGANVANVSADAERLAGLYCQIAYAHAALSPQGLEQVRQFWHSLGHATVAN